MHRNRVKKQGKFRLLVQIIATVFFNGYFMGIMKGKIYTGKSKGICVPVLNCYSCPSALGACPIGALQTVAGGQKHKISFYALGTLMVFGVLLGRLICGFLCPFGLFQDLLDKIPVKKISIPKKIDKPLRYLKYGILLFLVLLFPAVITDQYGTGEPWFCEYICPAGTMEGGLFHVAVNEQLRKLVGTLFYWKVFLLVVVIIGAMKISRFFCRYVCPLGAFYSLFNRFSFHQMYINAMQCTHCHACEKVCPMALNVPQELNSSECIRCGKCRAVCPEQVITSNFSLHEKNNICE